MKEFRSIVANLRAVAEDEEFWANIVLLTFGGAFLFAFLGISLLSIPSGADVKNGVGLIVLGSLCAVKVVLNLLAFLPRNRVKLFDTVHASWPVRGLLSFTAFVLICAFVLPHTGHVSGPFWGGVSTYLLVTSVCSVALFWNPLKSQLKGFVGRWRQEWMEKHLIADLKNSLWR